MSNDNNNSTQLPRCDHALPDLRDDGIIRLPPQEIPDKHRGRPLTVCWEIEIATGERAKHIERAQAEAIWALLAWAAKERSESNLGS